MKIRSSNWYKVWSHWCIFSTYYSFQYPGRSFVSSKVTKSRIIVVSQIQKAFCYQNKCLRMGLAFIVITLINLASSYLPFAFSKQKSDLIVLPWTEGLAGLVVASLPSIEVCSSSTFSLLCTLSLVFYHLVFVPIFCNLTCRKKCIWLDWVYLIPLGTFRFNSRACPLKHPKPPRSDWPWSPWPFLNHWRPGCALWPGLGRLGGLLECLCQLLFSLVSVVDFYPLLIFLGFKVLSAAQSHIYEMGSHVNRLYK